MKLSDGRVFRAGKTMLGRKLKIPNLRSEEVQKQTDTQLKEVITNGKAKMPAYKGKLTPQQIRSARGRDSGARQKEVAWAFEERHG
jgi:hypothetical protein